MKIFNLDPASPRFHLAVGLVIAVLFLVLYIVPLGVRPLVRPDEFRYGEIPREMIQSGNWIAPKFIGIRYFEKPPVGYQLTAASFKIFGRNAFALRLPSALSVGVVALFLYLFLVKKTDDPLLPGLATLTYLCSGLVVGVGTFAVLDSQLTMALTLTLGFYYLAWDSKRKSVTVLWLVATGLAAGLAFGLKGFLAFVVPGLVIAPFLVWMKDWKKLLLHPWIPVFVALLVSAPWASSIYVQEPDFWNYFFVEEHWKRFTSGTYDKRREPVWYYLPVLSALLPSGLLILESWRGWTRDFFRQPLARYLLLWTVLPFLFYSASSCKLGTYILPCFPPCCVLLAMGALAACRKAPESCARAARVVARIFLAVLLTASVVALTGFLLQKPLHLPAAFFEAGTFRCLLVVTVALVWSAALWSFRKRGAELVCVLFFGLAAFFPAVEAVIPYSYFRDKMPERGIAACARTLRVDKDWMIFADRNSLGPVAWTLERTDIVSVQDMGELQYGLKNYPADYPDRFVESEAILPSVHPEMRGKRVYVTVRNLKRDPLRLKDPSAEIHVADGVTFVRF